MSWAETTTGECRTIEKFGRSIVLVVSNELDEHGQFRVGVIVSAKERWSGHFTDKSEDR